MEQQQQRTPAADKPAGTQGVPAELEAYKRLVAQYSAHTALTATQRTELFEQMRGLLPKGRYCEVGGAHLVRVLDIGCPEEGRAIDCFVGYEELSGVTWALPILFFLEMHRFSYVDGAS